MADEDKQDPVLNAFQRQQAAAAVAASQGQPNSIPATGEQPQRAMDYAQAGAGVTGFIAQPPPNAAPQVGNFLDQSGNNIGPTHDAQMRPLPVPTNATGVEGQVASPAEQQFWAANPLGAVPHPDTGELIGLGSNAAARKQTLEGVTPPAPAPRQPPPDFVQIPQIDPAIAAQRHNIQGEIANVQDQLRGASTARGRHGAPSSAEILQRRLEYLSHADSGLAQHQAKQQADQATAATKNLTMQQKWSIDRDVTAFHNGLSGLPPVTDPGYKAALYKLDRDNPDARKDPRIEAFLLAASHEHDWRTEAEDRARAAGLTVETTGIGQRGPTEKFVNPQAVPSKSQTRYDVLQAAIKGHLEQSAVEAKKNVGTKDVPYSNASTLHAQQAEAASLEKQFPGLNPRNQLARKALDDPNASEEHKAAARKILGLQ